MVETVRSQNYSSPGSFRQFAPTQKPGRPDACGRDVKHGRKPKSDQNWKDGREEILSPVVEGDGDGRPEILPILQILECAIERTDGPGAGKELHLSGEGGRPQAERVVAVLGNPVIREDAQS
jgi:hypothetical protein